MLLHVALAKIRFKTPISSPELYAKAVGLMSGTEARRTCHHAWEPELREKAVNCYRRNLRRRCTTVQVSATALVLGLGVAAAAAGVRYLPDPATTSGALNPAVTQANIGSTICRRGWTHSIRPGEPYTERLKREQLYTSSSPYFAPDERLGAFEEDHRVPLGLGGAPYDRRNLWPEPRFGRWNAERKDELEGIVHDLVCGGRLTLAQGRAAFLGDWTQAYRRYVGKPWRSDAGGLDRAAPLSGTAAERGEAEPRVPPLPPLPPISKPPVAARRCVSVPHYALGPGFFKVCH